MADDLDDLEEYWRDLGGRRERPASPPTPAGPARLASRTLRILKGERVDPEELWVEGVYESGQATVRGLAIPGDGPGQMTATIPVFGSGGVVRAWRAYDAAHGGELLFEGELDGPRTLLWGDALQVKLDLTVSI